MGPEGGAHGVADEGLLRMDYGGINLGWDLGVHLGWDMGITWNRTQRILQDGAWRIPWDETWVDLLDPDCSS